MDEKCQKRILKLFVNNFRATNLKIYEYMYTVIHSNLSFRRNVAKMNCF